MQPDIQQTLNAHVSAIAQLLYTDAKAQGLPMASLGELEQTVRTQLQTHVSPRVGQFLSTQTIPRTATPPDA